MFFFSRPNEYFEFGCLLQAVKSDLKVPEYFAACKALGHVSHLIMLPLWSQIENTDISIFRNCSVLQRTGYIS